MRKKLSKIEADQSWVIKYKHFDELRDCLASGWSPRAVWEYLKARYGEEGLPGHRTIQRWRDKHLGEAEVIPHRLIAQKLKGVTYKVDVVNMLSRLIAILEDRVCRGIEQESIFGDLPLAINDDAVRTYLSALGAYTKVAQDLGIIPRPPPSPMLFDMRNQTLNISPEVAEAFKSTAEYVMRLEQGGLHDAASDETIIEAQVVQDVPVQEQDG